MNLKGVKVMEIRELKKEELKKALNLILNVFLEFEAHDYSEEGINEFKSFIGYQSILKKYENEEMKFWCAVSDEKIEGVIAIRNKTHISLLFVDKKHHKEGIGKKLIEKATSYIIDTYENKINVLNITVNSSPYAVEFYHKCGFKDINVEEEMNGIRFTSMLKKIK